MTLPEFAYTVLLKPRPLRAIANATLRALTPATIERYGARIHLNPRDPVVSGALALGVYEKPETRFFLKTIAPGMTFLDVGANVGYYSALALARIGPAGRVIAFEPDPETFEYLQRTIAANGPDRTTALNKGLADTPGTLRLYRNSSNRGDNRFYANDLADNSVESRSGPRRRRLGRSGHRQSRPDQDRRAGVRRKSPLRAGANDSELTSAHDSERVFGPGDFGRRAAIRSRSWSGCRDSVCSCMN